MYRLTFTLVLGIFTSFGAFGATLLNLDLIKDGSAKPPGDRIVYTVGIAPGEEAVNLEFRVYETIGGDLSKRVPIRAAMDAPAGHRDELGNLRIKIHLTSRLDAKHPEKVDGDAIFPYSSFDLPVGDHTFYYEVTASRDDADKSIEFVSATVLSVVKIGEDSRNSLLLFKPALPPSVEKIPSRVFIIDANGNLKNPEGEPTELESMVASAASPGVDTVAVNIPKGFVRKTYTPPDGKKKVAAASDFKPEKERVIYFATNRNVVDKSAKDENRFGGEPGALTYGNALVNIPVSKHKKGTLEEASWWNHDPNKVFLIETLASIDASTLFSSLSKHDTLMFVHGFNNSFKDAILKTAQIHHDIEFPGRSMAFSWPSRGKAGLGAYSEDEVMAKASYTALAEALRTTLIGPNEQPEKRDGKVHLMAHSMGNRVLLYALAKLITLPGIDPNRKYFGHIVLAAPDVDVTFFSSMMPKVTRLAERVTFYYSKSDMALGVSNSKFLTKHNIIRAGLYPQFSPGMDTVDADNANSWTMSYGHNYYSGSDRVLYDINLATQFELSPDKRRPPLHKKELADFPEFPHYVFKAGN